jgi:hypothetical protein
MPCTRLGKTSRCLAYVRHGYESVNFRVPWGYFPGNSTVLIDKIHKYEDTRIELGGAQAEVMLRDRQAIAAHATCYEKDTKMMALKAANAFWNPYYYDPTRRTLTKQLLYVSEEQLRDEIRSLVYLAKISNRSLIVPNVLGRDDMSTVNLYDGRLAMWPGFRTMHFKSYGERGDSRFDEEKNFAVTMLEPAFYWRIQRDYYHNHPNVIPSPTIVSFDSSSCPKSKDVGVFVPCKLSEIEKKLLSPEIQGATRVVLNFYDKQPRLHAKPADLNALAVWAADSVGGSYPSYKATAPSYHAVPALSYGHQQHRSGVSNKKLSETVIEHVRPCMWIFNKIRGNRSCFDKCK